MRARALAFLLVLIAAGLVGCAGVQPCDGRSDNARLCGDFGHRPSGPGGNG